MKLARAIVGMLPDIAAIALLTLALSAVRVARLLLAFLLSPYCDAPIALLFVLFIALCAAGVIQ